MPAPEVNLATIATPVLLGYVLNWGLFGALTIQIYLYHVAFEKDSKIVKFMVYVIFLIEAAQTFLVTHDAFNAYVVAFGRPSELDEMQNEWLAVPVFSALVSSAVQVYYGYRIALLSGSWKLRSVITSLAVIQCVAGIMCGVQALKIGRFSLLSSREFISTSIWLCGCTLCDIVIAVSMAYYLIRGNLLAHNPQYPVISLIRCIIETGSLTALMATVDLIIFLSFTNSAYYACFALILAKLYSNSLLVMFNSQTRIIGARNWVPAACPRAEGEAIGLSNEAEHSGRDATRLMLSSKGAAVAFTSNEIGTNAWSEAIKLDRKVVVTQLRD